MNPVIINGCEISFSTPSEFQHYFGFHDVSPWNCEDQQLALLRVESGLRRTPMAIDRAEVCLWTPGKDLEVIGDTRAFNWQQGSRLQWLPGVTERLITNDLVNGRPMARIWDPATRLWNDPIPAIYAIDPSGSVALSPDFTHLATRWRDYSYDIQQPPEHPQEERGSLFRIDIASGISSLLVDVRQARELCGQKETDAKGRDFISHPTFSPSGARISLMYRRFSDDGALFSFFLVAKPDGSDLRVLAREKCSHFDWVNDDQVLLWTRRLPGGAAALRSRGLTRHFPFKQMVTVIRTFAPKLKQSLFAEMYYVLDCYDPSRNRALAPGILEQDGHPMFTPDREWMVTDTYAFEGFQPLVLYSMKYDRRADVVKFPVHPDFMQPAVKCDLHPRWNRSGTKIAVDSAHTGSRQLYIVDVASFIAANQS